MQLNDCNVTKIRLITCSVYLELLGVANAGHVALTSSISLSPGTGLVLFVISSLPMAPVAIAPLVGLKRQQILLFFVYYVCHFRWKTYARNMVQAHLFTYVSIREVILLL